MNENSYSLILLCTQDTIGNVKNNYSYLQKYLRPKEIIVIANKKVKEIIEKENILVRFEDEDLLYEGMNYQNVKKAISKRSGSKECENRAGWYFQQFLKMVYSLKSLSQDYLVWDSDTIPTHTIDMYAKDGRRYFDVKTECHKPYFDTLEKLLPGLGKECEFSFISEHMLFNSSIMLDLIHRIEENNILEGKTFWEKIINAVSVKDLAGSGFSEFESYGNFVIKYYKDMYEIRKWKSLREGTVFYGNSISERQLLYLSSKYDAISFERHSQHKKMKKIFCRSLFQKLYIIKTFEVTKKVLGGLINR